MLLQARLRGWLARRAYRRVKAAVVLLQCCVRRRAARKELLALKAEARSVEKYRELNKGMEVKLMQLQLRADHQVGGTGGPPSSHTDHTQAIWETVEMFQIQFYGHSGSSGEKVNK